MDYLGIIKAVLDRLSFSIGIAFCVASGFAVFSPKVGDNIDIAYQVIAWVVFVFSSAWVVAEIGRWGFGLWTSHKNSINAERSSIYLEIHRLQRKQASLSGSHWVREKPFELAAEISDKYVRLNRLGIPTPEIDIAAGEWDFAQHNYFLTTLSPFLLNSPMKEVKAQAHNIRRSLPT